MKKLFLPMLKAYSRMAFPKSRVKSGSMNINRVDFVASRLNAVKRIRSLHDNDSSPPIAVIVKSVSTIQSGGFFHFARVGM